jgi:hypothetical protein
MAILCRTHLSKYMGPRKFVFVLCFAELTPRRRACRAWSSWILGGSPWSIDTNYLRETVSWSYYLGWSTEARVLRCCLSKTLSILHIWAALHSSSN